jgi:hypothetical protein
MASVWKHPQSRYWTACIRDLEGLQCRISTKTTNCREALQTAKEFEWIIREHQRETQLRKNLRNKPGYGPRGAYQSWHQMLERCFNLKHPSYQWYGGRGITVCKRWKRFEAFLEDMGERPEGKTIGRLDHDKGYKPDNCEWQTPEQQAQKQAREG